MEEVLPKERKQSELLKSQIFEEIRVMGMIPFVRYMELALYHPEYGYYNSPWEKIGKGGDYYTSPHIHPVFGRLIARQIQEMWRILGKPAPFTLIELGPGMGWLAHDILTEIEESYPEFFGATLYGLIETSPVLIRKQKRRLDDFVQKGKVSWKRPDDLKGAGGESIGCFLNNEFFDALPCHLVCLKGGRLREVYVKAEGNALQEVLGPPSTGWLKTYLQSQGVCLDEGQRAEINLNALKWLKEISRYLQKGFVFTIDFGWDTEELYAPHRTEGTLQCHFRHRTYDDPFKRVGLQDMSAQVNFSALMAFGKRVGLETTGFSPQYRFLLSLGLLNEMAAIEEEIARITTHKKKEALLRQKWAMRSFIFPNELGYGFKVLVQHKGIEKPCLKGFGSFPPLIWEGKTWK